MTAIPSGAACYFCLGEEADEEGKLPVRDCSCRGDSAGFAHFSCLTKYCEQKCKAAGDGEVGVFTEPWKICNNCKQYFQDRLSIDLASACYSFAESTYGHPDSNKWDKLKVLTALHLQIIALSRTKLIGSDKKLIIKEMKIIIRKFLSMIDQTKKEHSMSSWVHMPKGSGEFVYYTALCVKYEAFAHDQLG